MPALVAILLAGFALPAIAEDALRLAAQALDARDYATAARHLQGAAKADPKNPKILSSLGLCFAALGRFPEAAELYRSLTSIEPRVAAHQYNLGLALLNANAYEGAEQAFHRVLQLASQHPKARLQLANAILGQARGGDTAKMKVAAQAYREALPANPQDPELRFNYAFTLARTGDEAGALREYREVVRLAPNVPQAHFFLGITHFQAGDWEPALASLKNAAARGMDNFDLHYYLGSTLLRLQDHAGARLHLEKAVRSSAGHPGVHFQLAALHRALGDKQQAAEEHKAFRELTAQQETRWRAETLETAAGRALKDGDIARGIAALLQAFAVKPDAVIARNLALAYLQQGDAAKARSFLEKALELAPNDATTHNYLGLLTARTDLTSALRHFDRAAELDPGLVDARFNAGVAVFELKRYDDAIARFQAAAAKSPDPKIREALALVLADAGRHDEARREFEISQRQRAGAR